MGKTITIDSIDNIEVAAKEFIEYISNSSLESNIFAFYGQMGAGKTTFIKAICNVLGVEDLVSSPTFTIVNEYKSAKGFPIYHFDFYRINKLDEAYDIGIDEYFNGHGLCLIEWPELIEELLTEEAMKVKIEILSPTERRFTIDATI
ncbi:MAG: tRNA (adenosine(37)-N6)-threonylcarbamoyltransferase complex ATPase subunit type 1 TsaE [Bacteroidales bacterium]|nr:tRNA (adenosine(37)-N6)-threonylcarbamoyltransferase complex ATPase subunit type 1 TsaE [Bacteroidales bacterium]